MLEVEVGGGGAGCSPELTNLGTGQRGHMVVWVLVSLGAS